MPDSLIERHSDELHRHVTSARASGRTVIDDTITLDVPNDEVKTWEIFFYWLSTSTLPNPSEWEPNVKQHAEVWVQAWLFGDRYAAAEFQDLAMLKLLKWCKENSLSPALAEKVFKATPSGSKLRTLVSEEIAWMLRGGSELGWSDLVRANEIEGFAAELAKMLAYYETEDYTHERFQKGDDDDCAPWKKFMVGSGPSKHWVYEYE